MTFRSRPALWFEAVCPREDAAQVAGVLASTGAVEIEVTGTGRIAYRLKELREGLSVYRALLPRYGRYWTRGIFSYSESTDRPLVRLRNNLERIDAWRAEADPIIGRIQELEEELAQLKVYAAVLSQLRHTELDFNSISHAGPFLETIVAVLPETADWAPEEDFVYLRLPLEAEQYFLAIGPRSRTDILRDRLKELKGRLVRLPAWLSGNVNQARWMVEKRKISSRQVLKDLYDQLSGLFISFELARVLGDMVSLSWFVDQVGSLELVSSKFVHITGWTSDRKGAVLVGALDRTRAPALIDFPPPPEGARPPQLFDNPWWARPFEFFARLMGTPGSDEIDPSPLLAVVVPVLFGYMFGDVGQGLVLCCAGLLLKRYSFSRLLIAGGISAMVFGFLFGSLFSREDVLPAFWLHPLDQPLTVLGLPLLLGITLLVLGQLLNAWGAAWRGDFKRWLAMDGGFLLAYLGLIGSFTQPVLVWAAIAGLGWYVGARFQAQRTSLTLLAGLGGFLEEFLRILANTVSFARVGAFALAHAGLSLAISILADSSGTMIAWLLIMILGNLLVILLEGLVVSVQTTRLVLLEFFSRFIRASGRTFIPMSPPPTILSGESR